MFLYSFIFLHAVTVHAVDKDMTLFQKTEQTKAWNIGDNSYNLNV